MSSFGLISFIILSLFFFINISKANNTLEDYSKFVLIRGFSNKAPKLIACHVQEEHTKTPPLNMTYKLMEFLHHTMFSSTNFFSPVLYIYITYFYHKPTSKSTIYYTETKQCACSVCTIRSIITQIRSWFLYRLIYRSKE